VLKWLRANGCPWDGSTLESAKKKYHYRVERWAKENGCPTERKRRRSDSDRDIDSGSDRS